MNRTKKAIQVFVGISVFLGIYWFIVRNQIVVEFLRPQVESGKLGVASANILTSVIEILAAIGGVVIFVVTRLLNYLALAIGNYLTPIIDGSSAMSKEDGGVENDPKRLTNDLARLLIQAVIEGNRPLTIQLAHRLAKREFLDQTTGGQS